MCQSRSLFNMFGTGKEASAVKKLSCVSGIHPGGGATSGHERWRPLASYVATRYATTAVNDERLVGVALAAITDAERRFGSRRTDFCSLAVPLAIKALRRHRHERIRGWPAVSRSIPTLQLAIVTAENELSRRLRRSPTVAEVADYLDLGQHQIIAGLEATWSADAGDVPAR